LIILKKIKILIDSYDIKLKKDIHLRFVLFEEFSKVLLRRKLKNNFIFITRQYDKFNEIIKKYKIIKLKNIRRYKNTRRYTRYKKSPKTI